MIILESIAVIIFETVIAILHLALSEVSGLVWTWPHKIRVWINGPSGI
ncbi:MAG: hypothetical protein ABJA67_14900 [Chthonomonadales bacterium]